MKLNSTTWWIIGFVVVIGGLVVWSNTMRTSALPTSSESSALLSVKADDHVKGAQQGSVVLVEYLDLECEACRAYFPIVKQMETEFGDKVTFVVRYFPLQGHKNGLTAALAAEAAGRQGKFWEMHDLLYTRQQDWGEKQVVTPEVFETYAKELGLNMEQYATDVASEEVKARVERDREEGGRLGVNSTPTFFLNGEKIANPQSLDAFRSLLQAGLGT